MMGIKSGLTTCKACTCPCPISQVVSPGLLATSHGPSGPEPCQARSGEQHLKRAWYAPVRLRSSPIDGAASVCHILCYAFLHVSCLCLPQHVVGWDTLSSADTGLVKEEGVTSCRKSPGFTVGDPLAPGSTESFFI